VRALTKKICLLGDFAVGKTSLVRRFVESRFDERYLSTIGVKVDKRVLSLSTPRGEAVLTLMIWDLSGGPDAGPVVPSYYRGAAGAIVTCDLTRPETLSGVSRYAELFLDQNRRAKLVLAANKTDLAEQRHLDSEELAGMAEQWQAPLFLTSAKTGEQVEAMFQELGQLLLATEAS
jgi:small GTP-binding protein